MLQINIQLGSASDQKPSEDVDPSDTKLTLLTEQVDTGTYAHILLYHLHTYPCCPMARHTKAFAEY